MKKILVTGAGGSPSTNFIRSLKRSKEDYFIVGVDSDKYCLQRAESDVRYLVPTCNDPQYIPILNHFIKKHDIRLLYSQPDAEIEFLSERREQLECAMFLPSKESIKICQNKFSSYDVWQKAGIVVPKTMMIKNESDLRECFARFGPKIWIREIQGAFGKGALPTSDYDQAKAWIDFRKGWGIYCGAQCLQPESTTWQSIWYNGELIVGQGRKRLYWEFANRAPSGVTGITGTGVTVDDDMVTGVALDSIHAIDKKPHGIWSVDLTYDSLGIPNPTEINIGRFFTTHFFFTMAGLNMPNIFVKLALGESIPKYEKAINPLPDDLAWVRGMDFLPTLTTMANIESTVKELEELRKTL